MSKLSESNSVGLIKSLMVIGSSQILSIMLSIIKQKGVAVLLGPSGIGLLSIYNSLLAMGQKTAGLGMKMSGVREVAAIKHDLKSLSQVRRVIFLAHLIQGLLAMFAIWVYKETLSIWLIGTTDNSTEIGIVGVIIFIALISSSQIALLQGMRRINALGRITIFGAFIATTVGLFLIWIQGMSGLIWLVFIQPLASVLIALKTTRSLPRAIDTKLNFLEALKIWKSLASLGIAFMLGALITTLTILIIRSRILQELGLDAAGHFAAAWGLTMTYIGPMLAAMGADYFPRLSEVIHKKMEAIKLINDQTQLSLSIGGPLLLLMIGLAPWIIVLLYTPEFQPAIQLLQWQSLGNIFKIASWALVFTHVAKQHAKIYFLLDACFNLIFLLILWPLLSSQGILIIGPAFVLAYATTFLINIILVRKLYGFYWEGLSIILLILHICLSSILLVIAINYPYYAALISIILAAITGLFGLRIVISKIGNLNQVTQKFFSFFQLIRWPIK